MTSCTNTVTWEGRGVGGKEEGGREGGRWVGREVGREGGGEGRRREREGKRKKSMLTRSRHLKIN